MFFTRRLPTRYLLGASMLCAALPLSVTAQGNGTPPSTLPAPDATARLREVLPPDVADRVIARITEARSKGLAAAALEQRALKFAARGIAPAAIERSVSEQLERQQRVRETLRGARSGAPAGDELDAGAEAMRQGVSGANIAALAKAAPSGRSLSVPLAVLGELQARGLPSDEALARVQERLAARATDREMAELPVQARDGQARNADNAAGAMSAANRPDGTGKPALTGRELAATKRPASAGGNAAPGGPPTGVPAAPRGNGNRPVTPPRPGTPPRKGPPAP